MTDPTPGHRHSADPAALEDPVHHDVAEHELSEEQELEQDRSPQEQDRSPEEPDPPTLAPTGDERVDAAVARLGETAQAPPDEHAEIYEDVHRRLQDTLADLDGS